MKSRLIDFAKNIYSQFGEDGIIEKIFSIIKPTTKLCVEFGAWDGEYLSNTANLWKNKDWNAVLIEADEERIKSVEQTSKVLSICAKIGWDNQKDSVDFILKKNSIFEQIDFMSIDIDGDDYWVFEQLECRPNVICIEYNPTVPFWIDCVQEPKQIFGASLAAMNRLAQLKEYFLAAVTDSNLFFIRNNHKKLFKKFDFDIANIACYNHYISMITTYDGKYLQVGNPPYGMKEKMSEKDESMIMFMETHE